MTDAFLQMIFERLREKRCEIAPGLSDGEVGEIERRYDFRFPPDLRRFLQMGLPILGIPIDWREYGEAEVISTGSWVNWRDDSEQDIRERLDLPADGICFDIEYNNFWRDDWGRRPMNLQDAFTVARASIAAAPKLIPIFGHRFIPEEPSAEGNPVFSVIQTDIIYYGDDLASYFLNELNGPTFSVDFPDLLPDWVAKSPRSIRFWDYFV
jgi:hypothetical protein